MCGCILVLDGLLSADPYCIMPRWMSVPGPCTGNDTWDGYQWSREPWPGPLVSGQYLVDDSLTAHQIFLPSTSLSIVQDPGATAGFPSALQKSTL